MARSFKSGEKGEDIKNGSLGRHQDDSLDWMELDLFGGEVGRGRGGSQPHKRERKGQGALSRGGGR